MSLESTRVITWRVRKKYELLRYKGGKCEKCGYDKIEYPSVFHFHHLESKEKDFTISGKSYSFLKLKAEVDKCQLLCSNCHAEIHAKEYVGIYKEAAEWKKKELKPKRKCRVCFKEIDSRATNCKEHAGVAIRKYTRPNDKELEILIKEMTVKDIARKYNVSFKLVYKWIKKAKLKLTTELRRNNLKMASMTGFEPAFST